MKKFVMSVLAFLVLMTPSLAFGQSVGVDDCSGGTMTLCEVATFAGQPRDSESDMVVMFVQHFDMDGAEMILHDEGVAAFIDGMNTNEIIFTPEADLTEDASFPFLGYGDGFRLIFGTSDVVEPNQETVLLVVYANGKVYTFFSMGLFKGFGKHVEDVITQDDITIVPKDFVSLNEGKPLRV